jgi:hypothetical protein
MCLWLPTKDDYYYPSDWIQYGSFCFTLRNGHPHLSHIYNGDLVLFTSVGVAQWDVCSSFDNVCQLTLAQTLIANAYLHSIQTVQLSIGSELSYDKFGKTCATRWYLWLKLRIFKRCSQNLRGFTKKLFGWRLFYQLCHIKMPTGLLVRRLRVGARDRHQRVAYRRWGRWLSTAAKSLKTLRIRQPSDAHLRHQHSR